MNERKPKLTLQSPRSPYSMEISPTRRVSAEIQTIISSPEVKKFETFLFESLTSKSRLSMKFAIFKPINLNDEQ